MSADSKDDGVLSRWARRKAEVARETALEEAPVEAEAAAESPQAEPDTEEAALEVLRERDPELAERIAGIDIDKLAFEDDFTIFMNKKVPEFIRRRALSKLWLLSPVLANVDGLNDYDEDFTAAADAMRVFKSAYIPGKGYPSAEPEELEDEVEPEVDDEPEVASLGGDDVVPDTEHQTADAAMDNEGGGNEGDTAPAKSA